MEQAELIAGLKAQLKEVDNVRSLHYDSAERRSWEKESMELLRDGFGADSAEVLEFLDAPLGKLTPNMSQMEWQDNYDYLLGNQAKILERIIDSKTAVDEHGTRKIGVVGVGTPTPRAEAAAPGAEAPAPGPLSEHFLLDVTENEHRYVPDVTRTAIIGLENLLKAEAPWPEVRQQIFVMLTAERPIAITVLRALPAGLHLCTRDR